LKTAILATIQRLLRDATKRRGACALRIFVKKRIGNIV